MTYWSRNSKISLGLGSSSHFSSELSESSSSMISLHRSMHSSQMYTPGPAMSFLTCFWLFPQNEHLSRSPLSPMRATPPPQLLPVRPARLAPTITPTSDLVEDIPVAGSGQPSGQTGTALSEVRTSSMIPYSRACSAVRYLSRSMSLLTSSVLLPVSVASMSSISDRMRRISLAWISMSED